MDVSVGYLLFFSCSWAGEREEAFEEVAGGAGSNKNKGRGRGLSEEEVREREGRWGNVCGEGGWVNIYFRGRSAHQEKAESASVKFGSRSFATLPFAISRFAKLAGRYWPELVLFVQKGVFCEHPDRPGSRNSPG